MREKLQTKTQCNNECSKHKIKTQTHGNKRDATSKWIEIWQLFCVKKKTRNTQTMRNKWTTIFMLRRFGMLEWKELTFHCFFVAFYLMTSTIWSSMSTQYLRSKLNATISMQLFQVIEIISKLRWCLCWIFIGSEVHL